MAKLLCIYHGNCADGFGAAWVVRKKYGAEVDFHAGVYQNAPPDVDGRDVLLVDFSYKRDVIRAMLETANHVTILDHHKTAIEDLTPLVGHPHLTVDFDLNRSGAGIAWDWFYSAKDRPALIDHIEDRDLWRYKLPGTREIQAALFSYPYDFDVWDELVRATDVMMGPPRLWTEGVAIERKHFKDIHELLGVTQRRMVIGGVSVPVANLPYTLTSDAGNIMATADESKIGVCYWDTPEGRVFSLRSTDDGPDVSAIATRYGGGGHAHASGFRMPIGWEGEP